MASKLNLSVGEVQGHLRHMLELRKDLTAEERYSLHAAVESMEFVKILSPGLKKAVAQGHQFIAARAI